MFFCLFITALIGVVVEVKYPQHFWLPMGVLTVMVIGVAVARLEENQRKRVAASIKAAQTTAIEKTNNRWLWAGTVLAAFIGYRVGTLESLEGGAVFLAIEAVILMLLSAAANELEIGSSYKQKTG